MVLRPRRRRLPVHGLPAVALPRPPRPGARARAAGHRRGAHRGAVAGDHRAAPHRGVAARRRATSSRIASRERTTELRAALAQTQKDMAERRRLEEQLAQVQKLESIGRLAGGVAHDINNVLTVVLSYSDLVDAGLGPSHPLQAQLRQIRKAAERASNLTHRLLAFARKQIVEPRVINLGELSLNLDGMLRRLIGEDVELLTVTSPNLWSVKADPHQIEQVLVNLAVNARDAMPQGGTLRIETTQRGRRRGVRAPAPDAEDRRARADVGERHRHRHGRTRDAAHVRAVLHDQGAGQGHRSRPGDVLRHRPAARRRDLSGERAGQGHDLQRLHAARRPAGRADAAAARDAPSSAAPRRCCWSRTSRWCATSPRARCPIRATRCSRPSTARRRSRVAPRARRRDRSSCSPTS